MKLTFLGATHTVTGSKYLVQLNNKNILIDCGLFQGYKELRLRNWEKLPFDPATLNAVILTHAHIDHSGYLPLLVKNGFSGKIFCTYPTRDLCAILLPDSGHLQEEEAYYANLHGYSKHHPALPLYTKADADRALTQFSPLNFGIDYQLDNNTGFSFHRAGHILGAAFILIKQDQTSLLFSGDMGRPHDPLMKPPAIMQAADYLVLESTYGNKLHESIDVAKTMANIINKTVKRGGSIIIPAFAVGRAQSILYYLYQLKKSNQIPTLPIFLDSPMATNATKILNQYSNEHRLSEKERSEICATANYVTTPEESKAIDNYKIPIIIISASGMLTGGRVLHHVKLFGTDPRNTILFTGYQAGGTRGDRLLKGETTVKILGEMITIRAEIAQINNMSAHADYQEILEWLQNFSSPPRKTFLTHGEPAASQALKLKIENQLNWHCEIPDYLQTEAL